MLSNSLSTMGLVPLSIEDQITINGGKPTADTGFWYDVTWGTVHALKFVAHAFLDGASMIKG